MKPGTATIYANAVEIKHLKNGSIEVQQSAEPDAIAIVLKTAMLSKEAMEYCCQNTAKILKGKACTIN